MHMIEIIDSSGGELIGHKYSAEERKAALAAVALYSSQLLAGRICDDPEAIADGLDIADEVRAVLAEDLPVPPHVHEVMRGLFLPYIAAMHEGLATCDYAGVCEVLGVRPFELFTNAMTARRILDESGVDVEIIGGY